MMFGKITVCGMNFSIRLLFLILHDDAGYSKYYSPNGEAHGFHDRRIASVDE
jgi:hypothetical protein